MSEGNTRWIAQLKKNFPVLDIFCSILVPRDGMMSAYIAEGESLHSVY